MNSLKSLLLKKGYSFKYTCYKNTQIKSKKEGRGQLAKGAIVVVVL